MQKIANQKATDWHKRRPPIDCWLQFVSEVTCWALKKLMAILAQLCCIWSRPLLALSRQGRADIGLDSPNV